MFLYIGLILLATAAAVTAHPYNSVKDLQQFASMVITQHHDLFAQDPPLEPRYSKVAIVAIVLLVANMAVTFDHLFDLITHCFPYYNSYVNAGFRSLRGPDSVLRLKQDFMDALCTPGGPFKKYKNVNPAMYFICTDRIHAFFNRHFRPPPTILSPPKDDAKDDPKTFLDLPPELRTIIYDLVIEEPVSSIEKAALHVGALLGLMGGINSEIRKEVKSIFCGAHDFYCHDIKELACLLNFQSRNKQLRIDSVYFSYECPYADLAPKIFDQLGDLAEHGNLKVVGMWFSHGDWMTPHCESCGRKKYHYYNDNPKIDTFPGLEELCSIRGLEKLYVEGDVEIIEDLIEDHSQAEEVIVNDLWWRDILKQQSDSLSDASSL